MTRQTSRIAVQHLFKLERVDAAFGQVVFDTVLPSRLPAFHNKWLKLHSYPQAYVFGGVDNNLSKTGVLMKQGKPITASLEHVVFYPAKERSHYPTIVALHGRGTDAHDLLPLVSSLGVEDALLVAPRAPLPFNFGPGFAWYVLQEEGVPEPETFLTSLDRLRKFLMEVRAGYPVDQQKIILLGFSQGTVMAYAAGLLEPSSVLGIAALSGYIPVHSGLPLKLREVKSLAAFVSHGTYDELIPVRFGRESADLLEKAGADVVYREYAMGHEVSEATLRDLTAWTRNLLSK